MRKKTLLCRYMLSDRVVSAGEIGGSDNENKI